MGVSRICNDVDDSLRLIAIVDGTQTARCEAACVNVAEVRDKPSQ